MDRPRSSNHVTAAAPGPAAWLRLVLRMCMCCHPLAKDGKAVSLHGSKAPSSGMHASATRPAGDHTTPQVYDGEASSNGPAVSWMCVCQSRCMRSRLRRLRIHVVPATAPRAARANPSTSSPTHAHETFADGSGGKEGMGKKGTEGGDAGGNDGSGGGGDAGGGGKSPDAASSSALL